MIGDYMEAQTLNVATKPKIELSHEQLLEALYFFWDGFDRSSMDFFLVKDTADQAIADKPLSGDKLTLGIRKMEWNGGQQRIFKGYMEHNNFKPIEKTKEYLLFKYKEVPVYLYIYDQNPCLDSFNVIFYKYETFNTPNPYDVFSKTYDYA